MRENTAKAKLKSGQAIIGPIIGFTSPQLVEIAGRAGFDFVFIDCEHGAIGLDECENLVRAADVVGLSTIVRVPENNPQQILRYLDLGAHDPVRRAVDLRLVVQLQLAPLQRHPQLAVDLQPLQRAGAEPLVVHLDVVAPGGLGPEHRRIRSLEMALAMANDPSRGGRARAGDDEE